jgi:serine/threonine protein kinase
MHRSTSYRSALDPGIRLHWYEIERVLGQGGFGITYLARDGNLGRFVAIKEYLPLELAVREPDLSVQPAMEKHAGNYAAGLARFISEARMLSKFKHPNIVEVLSVFEASNTAYMVMRYEKGESLADILRRYGTLSEGEIVRHMLPLLDGLQKVHEAGFIHRDIKPANIFTRKGGASSVLLDFGSARHALGLETRTLTNLVSSGYSPYEQYYTRGEEQGPWTDIYAAGATLYHMVTGAPPLNAIERGKGVLGSATDPLAPAIKAGKGRYSQEFLRAIDHALMFNPVDRPQSVSEWLEDFFAAASVGLRRPRGAKGRRADAPPVVGPTVPRAPSEEPTAVPSPVNSPVPRRIAHKVGIPVIAVVLMAAGAAAYLLYQHGDPDTSAGISTEETATLPEPPPRQDQPSVARENPAPAGGGQAAKTGQPDREESKRLEQERTELAAIERRRIEEEERMQQLRQQTDDELRRMQEVTNRAAAEIDRLERRRRELESPVAAPVERVTAGAPEPRTEMEEPPPRLDGELADAIADYEAGRSADAFLRLQGLAELGHAEAQRRIAAMYATGTGTGQNLDQAVHWYSKVAEIGDVDAQFSLAGIFASSAGPQRNSILAYVWYSVAAALGHPEAALRRATLMSELQPAEIQQASRQADAILARVAR